jgi:hypothetical protein
MTTPEYEAVTVGDVSTPWAMGHIVVRHLASGMSSTLTRKPRLPQDGPLYKRMQRAALAAQQDHDTPE